MTRKTLLDASLGLCTVGGAVFAVGASKEPLSKLVTLPDGSFSVLMIVGGVLVVVGGIAFMLSFVIDRIEHAVVQVAYGDIDSKYVCTQAQSGDLAGLHGLYVRYFGDDVPSVELMRSWVSRCASAFTLVHKIVQDSGLATRQELVGSFKVLPLTAKGVRAIELGQATGSTFRSEHILTGRTRPAGYYVGDVVATARFARGVVMAHLNASLTGTSAMIYARPLTSDGLRIMTKHGFVQVSDGKSPPQVGRACRLQTAGEAQSVSRSRVRRRRLTPLAQGAK